MIIANLYSLLIKFNRLLACPDSSPIVFNRAPLVVRLLTLLHFNKIISLRLNNIVRTIKYLYSLSNLKMTCHNESSINSVGCFRVNFSYIDASEFCFIDSI